MSHKMYATFTVDGNVTQNVGNVNFLVNVPVNVGYIYSSSCNTMNPSDIDWKDYITFKLN